jgi:hypothetical protein
MSEMNTRFQHLSHGHAGHRHYSSQFGLGPPRTLNGDLHCLGADTRP